MPVVHFSLCSVLKSPSNSNHNVGLVNDGVNSVDPFCALFVDDCDYPSSCDCGSANYDTDLLTLHWYAGPDVTALLTESSRDLRI